MTTDETQEGSITTVEYNAAGSSPATQTSTTTSTTPPTATSTAPEASTEPTVAPATSTAPAMNGGLPRVSSVAQLAATAQEAQTNSQAAKSSQPRESLGNGNLGPTIKERWEKAQQSSIKTVATEKPKVIGKVIAAEGVAQIFQNQATSSRQPSPPKDTSATATSTTSATPAPATSTTSATPAKLSGDKAQARAALANLFGGGAAPKPATTTPPATTTSDSTTVPAPVNAASAPPPPPPPPAPGNGPKPLPRPTATSTSSSAPAPTPVATPSAPSLPPRGQAGTGLGSSSSSSSSAPTSALNEPLSPKAALGILKTCVRMTATQIVSDPKKLPSPATFDTDGRAFRQPAGKALIASKARFAGCTSAGRSKFGHGSAGEKRALFLLEQLKDVDDIATAWAKLNAFYAKGEGKGNWDYDPDHPNKGKPSLRPALLHKLIANFGTEDNESTFKALIAKRDITGLATFATQFTLSQQQQAQQNATVQVVAADILKIKWI